MLSFFRIFAIKDTEMATNFYMQQDGGLAVDIESTFNIRVTSVRGLNPASPKELFTRDWAGEDGIDVYLPATRKKKATEVTMTCFAEKTDTKTAIDLYDEFCAYIFDGAIDYWDTLQLRKVNLIYNENKPSWYQLIAPQRLMFEITFLNKTGATTKVV